jgi:hypothetical protein
MCGTEYGGGGGGERRLLDSNALVGSLPVELGNLDNLVELCVRPPTPHLAMWGQPEGGSLGGKQVHGCCGLTPEEGELIVP